MALLILDCESTGLDPRINSVIEISARLDVNGVTVSEFSTKLFEPSKTVINLGALKVNKTKLIGLLKYKKEELAVVEFVDWLLSLQEFTTETIEVIGQNPRFDGEFLKALLLKYNVEGIEALIGYKMVDTYSIAYALRSVGKLNCKNLSLSGIAEGLGIDISQISLHSAVADRDLVAQVYYKLLELLRD